MGWGNYFPDKHTLNDLMKKKNHRDKAKAVFKDFYGNNGNGYTLGQLCHDWVPRNQRQSSDRPPLHEPPYTGVKRLPWKRNEARNWKQHCANLGQKNGVVTEFVSGQQSSTYNSNIRKKLEEWVKNAMLNQHQEIDSKADIMIVYDFCQRRKWDPSKKETKWELKREATKQGNREKWKITVTGPGF